MHETVTYELVQQVWEPALSPRFGGSGIGHGASTLVTSTPWSALELELALLGEGRTSIGHGHHEDDFSNDVQVDFGIYLLSDQLWSSKWYMQVREEQALATMRMTSVTTYRLTPAAFELEVAHLGEERTSTRHDQHEHNFSNDLHVDSGTPRKPLDTASAIVYSPIGPGEAIS